MKNWGLAVCAAVIMSACSGGDGGILPDNAVEVTENRVSNYTGADGRRYNLRTYIVPPESPFYITVAHSGRALAFETAGRTASSTAATYIRSRGCTGNMSRLSSQDVYDPASKTWTIVISC